VAFIGCVVTATIGSSSLNSPYSSPVIEGIFEDEEGDKFDVPLKLSPTTLSIACLNLKVIKVLTFLNL